MRRQGEVVSARSANAADATHAAVCSFVDGCRSWWGCVPHKNLDVCLAANRPESTLGTANEEVDWLGSQVKTQRSRLEICHRVADHLELSMGSIQFVPQVQRAHHVGRDEEEYGNHQDEQRVIVIGHREQEHQKCDKTEGGRPEVDNLTNFQCNV